MAVAIILDFPGGTKAQYDEVVRNMELGGKLPAGGLFHAAGIYEGNLRVIDVWESREVFDRFAGEKIVPLSQAAGLPQPSLRFVEVESEVEGSGEAPALVQIVTLPGLDRDSFKAADAKVRPGGESPPEITFHVNGPVDGGWCVVDAWTSRADRDAFRENKIKPAIGDAPLTGEPGFEDLDVEATLVAGAHATA